MLRTRHPHVNCISSGGKNERMEAKKENGLNQRFQTQLPTKARKLVKINKTDCEKRRKIGSHLLIFLMLVTNLKAFLNSV